MDSLFPEYDEAGVIAAKVVIDEREGLEFHYAIPEALVGRVAEGSRVRVTLRGQRELGTVIALEPPPAGLRVLRPLTGLAGGGSGDGAEDDGALFPPGLIALARWMSEYYLSPLATVFRGMVPSSVRAADESYQRRKHLHVGRELGDEELGALARRAPRQAAIYEAVRLAGGGLAQAAVAGETGGSASAIRALVGAGLLRVTEEVVMRDPAGDEIYVASEALELGEEQAEALAAIEEALDGRDLRPILLHGVTGSGKTEVYLQAIARVMEEGGSALFLVPEISLTPQTVERLKARFADRQGDIAIMHSHLSEGQRHDEWQKIRRGARVAIGARSAVFAPLRDLRLIIVDEEHENSYKQENPPRYQARDLAVVRGALEKCPVVLGSATPSLESYQNCLEGKYRRLEIRRRADGRSLPLFRLVDMRQERRNPAGKDQPGSDILSHGLREAVEGRLERGEQTILFLNRRGYTSTLTCQACGHVVECRHCAIPMTFHRDEEKLLCHLCGFRRVAPKVCPECKDPGIRFAGYGTQKVEAILGQAFPGARVARIDTDTMQRRDLLRKTLAEFRAQKIQILVGTQMIAKGLDFPNVTLVGVLNADLGLHVPDFRAGERTFQLLTQVAGRAGRGEMEGEVYVQTVTPHSPSIQFARHHDYDGFADQELSFRRQFGYPPFTHLALLSARCAHEARAEFTMETLHRRLEQELPKGIVLGEPVPSPLVRAHDLYRYQVILRSAQVRPLVAHIRRVMGGMTFPEDVVMVCDIDAYSLQ
jgi:primosomal protein N' (replication factor Y) (superfamily II helicase)